MCTAISSGQWQLRTATWHLLGLTSIAVGSMCGENPNLKDHAFTAEEVQSTPLSASSTQHRGVGVVGWKPQGSFPTTCAGKADHGLM